MTYAIYKNEKGTKIKQVKSYKKVQIANGRKE